MKLNEIEITDFNAPELDIYARCNEAQLLHYFEPAPGIFIAESPKVIERHYMPDMFPFLFWLRNAWLQRMQVKPDSFLKNTRMSRFLLLNTMCLQNLPDLH